MGRCRFRWAVIVLALAAAVSAPARAVPGAPQDGSFAPALLSKAQAELGKVRDDLKKIEGDLRGHDQTILKAEALAAKAREKKNAEVEAAAREYLQKACDAKARDEATRATLQEALRAARSGVENAQAAMGAWVKEYRGLIAERLTDAGTVYNYVLDSLKNPKDPPPPPRKPFADLRTGDVLLVAPPDGYRPGDLASKGLKFVDKLTSWEWGAGSSQASHTLMYLKTVNGQKLFLDDQLGEGPRIKTEEMILKEYAGRSMDVAHPIARIDADKLWTAAKELTVQNIAHIEESPLRLSTYNLYGDDHMVCSEASRWALVRAWPGLDEDSQIRDTASPFKKMLGVYFGPANFYSDRQHFIVSAVEMPK
jgi:hypothetical protein